MFLKMLTYTSRPVNYISYISIGSRFKWIKCIEYKISIFHHTDPLYTSYVKHNSEDKCYKADVLQHSIHNIRVLMLGGTLVGNSIILLKQLSPYR